MEELPTHRCVTCKQAIAEDAESGHFARYHTYSRADDVGGLIEETKTLLRHMHTVTRLFFHTQENIEVDLAADLISLLDDLAEEGMRRAELAIDADGIVYEKLKKAESRRKEA